MEFPVNTKIQVLGPLVRGRKGEYREVFEEIKKSGFVRVRVDGKVYDIEEEIKLEKNKKHNIDVVVDRLVIKNGIKKRLTDSLETALKLGSGLVIIEEVGKQDHIYSEKFACKDCGISYEEPTPRMFSFNSPFGACQYCSGLGYNMEIDSDLAAQFCFTSLRQVVCLVKPCSDQQSNKLKIDLVLTSKSSKLMQMLSRRLPANGV